MSAFTPQRIVLFTTSAVRADSEHGTHCGRQWIPVGHSIIGSTEANTIARTSFPEGLRERRWPSGDVHVVLLERSPAAPPGDECEFSHPVADEVVLKGETATEVALKLFGRSMRWADVFHSNNSELFTKTYLPSQLAEEGDGVYFDERIVSSLRRIGAIPSRARVLAINDLGGWDDLDRLDADLQVIFEVDGVQYDRMLVGSALVPLPPVTIPQWEKVLRARRSLLERSGIPTNVLSIERAVLYARRTASLAYIDSMEADNQGRVLLELGKICRRLDEAAGPLRGQSAVDDEGTGSALGMWADLGAERSAGASEFGVLGRLGLVDTIVVWSDIRFPPLPYTRHSSSDRDSCYTALMDLRSNWRDKATEGYLRNDWMTG